MKKTLTIFLVFILLFSNFTFATKMDSFKKQSKLNKFLNKSHKINNLKVNFDKKTKTPSFISGFKSSKKVKSPKDAATYLEENISLFDLKDQKFKLKKKVQDKNKNTHYKFNQEIDGIEVYGGEIIVHVSNDNRVYALNGKPTPVTSKTRKWKSQFKINKRKAIKTAQSLLKFKANKKTFLQKPKAKKYIYELDGEFYPVYVVNLEFVNPYPANYKVFVDAKNNKIIDSFNAIAHGTVTGTGTGVLGDTKTINTYLDGGQYYLIDDTKSALNGRIETYDANNGDIYSLPGTYMTDSDNVFDAEAQKAGVDAHYYAGVTYDYYYNVHGRNSFDNNGSTIKSSVHYKTNENNAFWTGSQMCYGDGDGTTFIPLSGSLDVVAHELTHAVTQYSADLEYRNQSGALNESMSDVFGVIVEYEVLGDSDWWRLGEDVYTPGNPDDALRDMKNPELYDQPAHMDNYQNVTYDNGGVHINSGIPNKAFYLIADSIGFDKTGDIYYKALTQYLTTRSDFTDARNALLQSAADLYGSSSNEYAVVGNSYAAVGIGEPITTDPTLQAATVASDSLSNTGTYTITVQIPANNTATTMELYENDVLIRTENFASNQSTVVEFTENYTSKALGTYSYKAILTDASNSVTSNIVDVTVTDTPAEEQWYEEDVSYDTPHKYSNNYDNTIYYTKTGATKVGLHFDRFQLERNYDFVYVLDGNDNVIKELTGNYNNLWVTADGDTIKLRMVTDYSVTKWGYSLDKAKYYSTQPISQLKFKK